MLSPIEICPYSEQHLPFGYICSKCSLDFYIQEHIVPFIQYCQSPERMLVMDLAPGGSLDTIPDCSRVSTLNVLKQALDALVYLHDSFSKPIVHRDIKPANILVKSLEPLHIWLADFGLSAAKIELSTKCGTPRYQAPEIWKLSYTSAVDIWSLGVLALERTCRLPAYHPKRWYDELGKVARKTDVNDPLAVLLRSMLMYDWELRPLASECLSAATALHSASDLQDVHDRAPKRSFTNGSQSSSQTTPRASQRPRQGEHPADGVPSALIHFDQRHLRDLSSQDMSSVELSSQKQQRPERAGSGSAVPRTFRPERQQHSAHDAVPLTKSERSLQRHLHTAFGN